METQHNRLHPEQDALTYGSHFIEVYDAATGHLGFGRVYTRENNALLSLQGGMPLDTVMNEDEFITRRMRDDGRLLSQMFTVDSPEGYPHWTNKAHAWPIERRLFAMASAAGWNINLLDADGRALVQIAYAAFRTHIRSLP